MGMTFDPLAPRVMPGGDTVCGYCDSGHATTCPHHQSQSPATGLFQIIKNTWGEPR